MIDILIDNKSLKSVYDIEVLDYSDLLGFAEIRQDEIEWYDKSGVDPNLSNIRYEPREFVIKCIVKANDIFIAKNKLNTLLSYMFSKGVFVLSVRDIPNGIRECFLCQRSNAITPTINIREQNSLYVFTLGLKDINPNAVKYYNEIIAGSTTIAYTKGQIANLYWGNGDSEQVENTSNYTKSDYSEDGYVDIIIDTDNDDADQNALIADFSADIVSGVKPQLINFTDNSVGDISLWSWDFGDGSTSSLQNPSRTYAQAGTYTVKLQVFNTVGGSATETKINYITIRPSWLMINATDAFLVNSTDKLLIN